MADLFDAGDLLAPLNAQLPAGMHPTHRAMAEEMYLHLAEDEQAVQEIGLDRLAELVVGQVDRVAQEIGGCYFYMPKGVGIALSARDREIAAEWRGNNGHVLARKYHLSEMRIGQIMKKWRLEQFALKQNKFHGSGFDLPTLGKKGVKQLSLQPNDFQETGADK